MRRPSRPKLLLWAILAVPAAVILVDYATSPGAWPGDMLPATGEWAARLIIVALALTPLIRLFPASASVRWLISHRRSFGVAAFLYSLLHLGFYLADMETIANMAAELGAPAIWTAWLALLCLVPPALASNDAAMRALGRAWKGVQRLAYPAAVLTLAHWQLVHDSQSEALLHFAPLAALQALRLVRAARFSLRQRTIA